MLTRRDALVGAISAGALMRTKQSLAKAAQPATPVNFDVPADACDCHTHIFGDPAQFSFFSGRVYTPETASPEEMTALHRALHVNRVVIVTPSVYGTDNFATGGSNDPTLARQRFQAALPRMASRNWHVQIYTNLAVIAAIKDLVLASPVPVVFDHC